MRFLFFTVILVSQPTLLHAQWRAAILAGTATSRGDSRDASDPAHPEFHAEAPATLTIAIARRSGAWQLAMDLHHTAADLAEISGTAAVATRNAMHAWGAGLEVARRVAGHPGASTLGFALGAAVDRWTFDLDATSARVRASARGALEAELPVDGRWSALVRGQATMGPSVFKAEELPEGFVQRIAVRFGMVLGVARRL